MKTMILFIALLLFTECTREQEEVYCFYCTTTLNDSLIHDTTFCQTQLHVTIYEGENSYSVTTIPKQDTTLKTTEEMVTQCTIIE